MRIYPAIVAIVVVLLFGVIPSGATQWYLRYPYFDKLLHLAGGFAIAWFIAIFFRRDIKRGSFSGALIIIVGGVLLVGFAWELAEYLSNVLFKDAVDGIQATIWRYFHGGDLPDTLLDMVADIVGALMLAGIFLPMTRRHSS
jgi:uncharacterized membrane protein YjdF